MHYNYSFTIYVRMKTFLLCLQSAYFCVIIDRLNVSFLCFNSTIKLGDKWDHVKIRITLFFSLMLS